jgi:LPS export ABC transporter permease LptF/LPS export ABC transporter permease LptG
MHMPEQHQMNGSHALFPSSAFGPAVIPFCGESMRLIDRYICREIFSHALLGLSIFTFVLFVPQLVRLTELIVRQGADATTIGILFLCTLPGVFTFTLPTAVLVGVLIGLGRMSADSEIIALHILGIGLRRILLPVGTLAAGAAIITLAMTSWAGPLAISKFRTLETQLRTTQASFEIQPRVFDERFRRFVLYVQDVEAAATRWRGLFLAETAPENRSRLTLAEQAIVITDREQGKLQLHLRNGATHEYSPDEPLRYNVTTFGQSDLPITITELAPGREIRRAPAEMTFAQLISEPTQAALERRVELHRRLAFPAACLAFALLAVPLGARPRRGGRAGGFILTLLLVCGYYLLLITGIGLARRGEVPPWLGVWGANLATILLGLVILPRMEEVGESFFTRWAEILALIRRKLQSKWQLFQPLPSNASDPDASAKTGNVSDMGAPLQPLRRATGGLPLLMDIYILKFFFNIFLFALIGFLILFHTFTFFELLSDIDKNNVPFLTVLEYFAFWTPQLLYQILPLAVLVATMVTMSGLSKSNELTALKASGVSVYRLTVPLLLAGGAMAALMVTMDSLYLPYANQRQDALRNEIKGRPPKTFFQPRRQWIFGQAGRLYNYELYDPDTAVFGGLNVFVLDPETFQMKQRVFAARAEWVDSQGYWKLQNGWVREFSGNRVVSFTQFDVEHPASKDLQMELQEPPSYFLREVRPHHQMNWSELGRYISDLQQAGFDVARLSVQWHRKFAYPMMAPLIVFLGIPFAAMFRARGTLMGLALALGIGIAYWAVSVLFVALGDVDRLPPLLAAWAPNVIFAFTGSYTFLKMPT